MCETPVSYKRTVSANPKLGTVFDEVIIRVVASLALTAYGLATFRDPVGM
jgi:hypothetical protein